MPPQSQNNSTSNNPLIPNQNTNTKPVGIPPHKIVFSAPPKDPTQESEKISEPIATPQPIVSTSPVGIPVHKIEFTAPPPPPTMPPEPPKPTEASPTMRSFAYDIKEAVADKGVDMAHIVLSETRKQEALHLTPDDIESSQKKVSFLKVTFITLGIIALVGTGVIGFLIYAKNSPVNTRSSGVETFAVSPFVRTEKNAVIELQDSYKSTIVEKVNKEREAELATKTLKGIGFKNDEGYFETTDLLSVLEAQVPETLGRALDPRFSFGILGGNKSSFMVLKSVSYENAYAGMIEWEGSLADDLGPLFFSGSEVYMSTTSEARKATDFTDKIYFNNDTRVLLGENDMPLMIWAIVNRTYIVLARDPETFEEIVKKMTTQNIVR